MSIPPGATTLISLETEAFNALCVHVVENLKAVFQEKRKWIKEKEAMERLNIASKTTMQDYRDKELIVFAKIGSKNILYDAESIDNFIEKHATGWVSEKIALRMLELKSTGDIRKLSGEGKIIFREEEPKRWIYYVPSIINYLDKKV